jgi:hypothetical protein
MRNKIIFSFFLIFLSSTMFFAQQKCKVLKVDIAGEYKGKCKNGLAHGTGVSKGQSRYEGEFKKGLPNGVGTIYYADGGMYIGRWKNGMKHGEGKYTNYIEGKDSIVDGIWKKDKYIGKKPIKDYDIIKKRSITRYTIKKNGDILNQVTIKVRYNRQTLKNALDNVYGTPGTRRDYYGDVVFENVNQFPFYCEMRYNVPSKTGTTNIDVEFIFKIFTKGEWIVEVFH